MGRPETKYLSTIVSATQGIKFSPLDLELGALTKYAS
jgi:hypothetical protein